MNQSIQSNKLKGKDLISIGIYSAIYFVINFIFMLVSGLHPIIWIFMPAFIALFSGIPFMLMCAKVEKMGAVLIMGAITALLYFLTGQFTVIILVTFLIACITSEICRYLSKYKSFTGNTIAFACYSVGMVGSPLPIWIMGDTFFSQIAEQGMPSDYVSTLQNFASTDMMIVMIIAPFFIAFVGAFITKKMFKKHFIKAGMV
ncbi:MptD family putative ECF transporter S component [Clostridium cadaveris]|uniref:MptD family putative ECF transporter S component n=1 Tax=Clostridium cadaveris TaxID=1529 RepID=UPI0015B5F884|nr:MptD family putative ECF transporter S component [Clostridium cadaveris]NWK09935.1 MptD family putative ECF transporter S component [Clostridium cadaveris]